MQSQIIALLVPAGSLMATLLVRRGDGQFALEKIDARVASATRVAGLLPDAHLIQQEGVFHGDLAVALKTS